MRNPPLSDGFNWSQKAFRRQLSSLYCMISFLIHKQLNGYRLPAEANSEAHLNLGSRLLGSDFLFIRVCLPAFSLCPDAKNSWAWPSFSPEIVSPKHASCQEPWRNTPLFAFNRLSRRPSPHYKESNPGVNGEIHSVWGYMDPRSFWKQPVPPFKQGTG